VTHPDTPNTSPDRLAEKMQSTASAVFDEVKEEGRRTIDKVQRDAAQLGEAQKDSVAARVGGVADSLRGASESLRTKDERMAANLTDAAAEQLERLSENLARKDLGTLARQVSDLARQHPSVFLGGAVMLGFTAARFAKSTSDRDDVRDVTDTSDG
jgi:hypothetical protein